MISIIVPVYNARRYLQKCLASVFKQTYTDFEVLLVDDGSTDTSPEICTALARTDARIRCLTQPHEGVSAARNTALLAAKGEYLFFLDSDDELHPCCLEWLHREMTKQGAAFSFCGYRQEPFEEYGLPAGSPVWEVLNSGQMLAQFCRNNILFGGIGGKMIAREAVGELRFDTGLSLGEDTLFLYELLRAGIAGVYTREPLYYYRAEQGALSALRSTAKGMRDIGRVRQRIEQGEEECGRTEHARLWADEYLSMLKHVMNRLPARELAKWRKEVAAERKRPYFRERPFRTRGAVFLAFYCPFVYQAIKTVYRFCKRGKKDQNDEDI